MTAVPLLAGCTTSLGPQALPTSRFDYNQAITHSWDEQLLLNLVRLRYRDTMQFLEVSSVIAQYELQGSAGASADLVRGRDDVLGLDAGVAYSERPTISYAPLQGRAFVREILSPISPATIILLSQSGWSIERLLMCCVQQVNELRNAPRAAGPTPANEPEWQDFRHLAHLLRQLQVAGALEVRVRGQEGSEETVLVVRRSQLDATTEPSLREALDLLGLPRNRQEFPITRSGMDLRPGEIALRGRSLLGVLFYLSQAVEVPPEDEASGRVTVTRTAGGERFDWQQLTGGMLSIEVAAQPPADAFVRVRYRGHWFFIDDRDLDSKTTFGLLTYLFSLQSAGGGNGSPLLTVSAGG